MLLALAAIGLVALAIALISIPSVTGPEIARRVEAALAQATGCDARVGAAVARPWRGDIELRDVALTCDGTEVARVPRLRAQLSLASLLRGRIDIARIAADAPVLRLDALALPGRRDGSPASEQDALTALGEIVVHDADVLLTNLPRGATLHLRHARITASGSLRQLRVRLSSPDASGSLEGRAITGASVRARGAWRGDAIEVDELVVDAPGWGALDADGSVDLSGPSVGGSGRLDTRLDLAAVSKLAGVEAPVEGLLHAEATWRFDASGPSLTGTTSAEMLSIRVPAATSAESPRIVHLADVESRIEANATGIDLSELSARAFDGDLAGRMRWRFGAPGSVIELQGELRDASVDSILAMTGPSDLQPLHARVDIAAQGAIPAGDPRAASGGFEIRWRPDERSDDPPLVGDSQLAGRVADGSTHVTRSDLHALGVTGSVTGRIDWDGAIDLHADLATTDLAATLGPARALLPMLEPIVRLDPHGAASWIGRIGGTLARPTLDGRLEADDLELAGLPVGAVEADVRFDEGTLRAEDAHVSGDLGRLDLDVVAVLAEGGSIDGTWQAQDVNVAAWLVAFGKPADLTGLASGEGRFTRDESGEPALDGAMIVAQASAFGMTLEEARLDAVLSAGGLRVRRASARSGEASFEASGFLPWSEGSGSLRVDVTDLPLPPARANSPARDGQPLAHATGNAILEGTLKAPRPGAIHARLDRLPSLLPWDALVVDAEPLNPDTLSFRLMAEGADVSGEGRIDVRAPHAASVAVRSGALAFLLGEGEDGEDEATLRIRSMRVEASGSPGDLTTLALAASVEGVELSAGALSLRAQLPMRITSHGRDVQLEPARLDLVRGADAPSVPVSSDPADGLEVSASLRLVEDMPWQASVRGLLPARALQPASGSVNLSGIVDADVRVEGSGKQVTWSGRVELLDAHVKPVGQPHAFEDVHAMLTFDGSIARLESATGMLGGGPVSATGHAELEGGSIARFALIARGQDVALRLPVDAELSSVSDFEIAWAGTPDDSLVTGQVELHEATWRKDVHLESSALRRSVRRPSATPRGPLDAIALDVRVVGDEGLFIDNDLARVEFYADTQVRGTLARPVVIGTAASRDEGRLTVQGVPYRLLGATAHFTSERPNDPEIQAQAETDLNGIHVLLTLGGRLSEPRIDLSSDPPMPRERILALLLTGGALGESAGGEPIDPSAGTRLGPLALGDSKGLDLLQVDPFSVDGDGGRTARLTVGKYLTPRLFAAYSSFLSGNQSSAAELRYAMAPTLALRLAREADGSSVIGIRYDRRGRPRKREPEPGSQRVTSVLVIGVPEPPGEQALRKALGFGEGDDVGPRALRRGARAARHLLRGAEHPLARVGCRSEPSGDGAADITCTVSPGERIALEISGLDRGLRKGGLRAVREAWADIGAEADLLPEARRALLEELLAEGHADASVTGEMRRDERGATVALVAEPGPVVRIASVSVRGTQDVDDRDVEAAIANRGLGVLRNPPLTPRRKEEARRFVAGSLVELGYLEAEVEPARVEREGDDAARLVLEAHPGERARAASIVVEGASAMPAADVRERMGLGEGDWLRPAELDAAARRIETRLDALGHPDATVSWQAEAAATGVVVRVVVDEGPAARVGRVVVEGERHVSESFIQEVVGLKEGAPLRRKDVRDAQARLSGLGIFRRAVLGTDRADGRSGRDVGDVRDVIVSIEERDRTDLAAGLGWASDDGPRLSLKVGRRHLFGRAASVGLDLQAGGDERAEVLAGWKRVARSRIDLLGTAGLREDRHVSFTARRLGMSIEASRPFGRRGEARLRYRIEDVRLRELDITPAEAGLEDGLLASIGMSYARDTRDDALEPQRGSLSSGDLVIGSPVLGSDAGWAKAFLQHARTLRLTERWSYSGGVRLGVGMTLGSTESIPISERFFAGGVTSVRGYTRDDLGPRDAEGNPVGGAATLVLNNEVRFRVSRRFSAVAFLDAGNAWEDASQLSLSGLKAAAGPGIGISTPAGPVRVYWGYPLDGSDPDGRLHVTFGPIF